MKLWGNILIGLPVLMAVTFGVQAADTYSVTNASKVNCTDSPHGLWTNSDIGGGACSNYFSIDGSLTIYNDSADQTDWYAVLTATATNPQNVVASIALNFTGFAADTGTVGYKQEGGLAYNTANVDFFTNILGTIDIGSKSYDVDTFAGGYGFQFGLGANAKVKDEFGASAWIKTCQDGVDGDCMTSGHWDLNLKLTSVPETTSLLLLMVGLIGLRFKKV